MEYYCNICEKKYKSYKSLWKHNYIYHKVLPPSNTTSSTVTTPINTTLLEVNKLKCISCNELFSRKDSLTRHINKNRCLKKNKEKENIKN